MIKLTKKVSIVLTLGLVGVFLVTACGGAPSAPPTPTEAEHVEAATEEAEHTEVATEEAEHEEMQTEEAGHVEEATEEAEHMEASTEEAGHEEEDTHAEEEHMEEMEHGVPEEAAAEPNPIEASDESVERGSALYAANCAVCHGETGEGDGPAAAGLEEKPSDLHEDHVQGNSDGALFYIISHGVPDSPMPPWENSLSEEERWDVVNFLRTFGE